jgi:hypothetical protein
MAKPRLRQELRSCLALTLWKAKASIPGSGKPSTLASASFASATNASQSMEVHGASQKLVRCEILHPRDSHTVSTRFVPLEIFGLWEFLMTRRHGFEVRDPRASLWLDAEEAPESASRRAPVRPGDGDLGVPLFRARRHVHAGVPLLPQCGAVRSGASSWPTIRKKPLGSSPTCASAGGSGSTARSPSSGPTRISPCPAPGAVAGQKPDQGLPPNRRQLPRSAGPAEGSSAQAALPQCCGPIRRSGPKGSGSPSGYLWRKGGKGLHRVHAL